MKLITKSLTAIGTNVVVTLCLYALAGVTIYRLTQPFIDYILFAVGSSAHFWYMRSMPAWARVVVLVASVGLNAYGMIAIAIMQRGGL
jgi:hypothetical protein